MSLKDSSVAANVAIWQKPVLDWRQRAIS